MAGADLTLLEDSPSCTAPSAAGRARAGPRPVLGDCGVAGAHRLVLADAVGGEPGVAEHVGGGCAVGAAHECVGGRSDREQRRGRRCATGGASRRRRHWCTPTGRGSPPSDRAPTVPRRAPSTSSSYAVLTDAIRTLRGTSTPGAPNVTPAVISSNDARVSLSVLPSDLELGRGEPVVGEVPVDLGSVAEAGAGDCQQLLAGGRHRLTDDLQRAVERGDRLAHGELMVGADPHRVVVWSRRRVGDAGGQPVDRRGLGPRRRQRAGRPARRPADGRSASARRPPSTDLQLEVDLERRRT